MGRVCVEWWMAVGEEAEEGGVGRVGERRTQVERGKVCRSVNMSNESKRG